ncbi:DUF2637 domain-containing protein [Rhodococcus gordoniae]|uniref:DUF2637 domain-containing protein n=1 Tax=Rhodococcus gordoniae TaxID=223392 RepID=UPI0020CB9385|nr:DUF2637 domain-containing protein [Rhodococcus gordoniae]UTT51200.1 DUF2637 domain-containing protein [Rhodococcus gordoniae]
MKWTKRHKNKNASAPENVTAVSGSMWFAGVTITVGIGAAAFILSFLALRDLCIQAGQPREIAFLFPVIVDGTILQATMGVVSRRHDHRARRFFWKILIGAATVSIAGNAIHAVLTTTPGFNSVLAAVIATLPPISLLASTHALTVLGRRAAAPTENPAETHIESAPATQPRRETAYENAAAPKTHVTTITENRAAAETASETPVARSTCTAAADALTRQLEVPLPHLPGTHLDTNPIPAFHSHEERREWALARRQAGVEVPVIAQEVDRSVATVYRWLSEADTSVTI